MSQAGGERKIKVGDKEVTVPLGELEFIPCSGTLIAEALVEHGVDVAFGVQGGHIWQIVDEMARHGIKIVTVRHEQTAVYAAEAYSKVKRRPGVAFATVGPGTGNIVSAVQQAYLSRSPIIVLLGGHEIEHDRLYTTIQEAYAEDLFDGISKWVQRIIHPCQIKQFICRAFKDAMSYPYGPVVLEFSISCLFTLLPPKPFPVYQELFAAQTAVDGKNTLYTPKWYGENTGKPFSFGGDPALIEKAVKAIYEAKSPVIIAADGAHWADAGPEIQEFCELAQVPVSGRRIGRGAVPETHPLHFRSRAARAFIRDADLVVIVGMKVGFFDGYGADWKKVIQITESPEQVWTWLPTEVVVIGNPKVVFRQMIECAKKLNLKPPPERKEWVAKVQQSEKEQYERLIARAEKYKDHKPLHHAWVMKVLWDIVEERYGGENYIIQDGYTMSDYSPPFIKARRSGQCMDASEQAGVGHSIGMSIGICFADPEFTRKKPVIALLGDAGVGNSGMDIETAQRYNLPIVYLITNNDGWLTSCKASFYSTSRGKQWDGLGPDPDNLRWGHSEFINDIRYDKMFEVIGCHGEWVTDPAQLKDALNRAFDAAEKGKVAVVNIDVDPTISNKATYTPVYALCWAHVPWDKTPKRNKALRRNVLAALFGEAFQKYGIPEMPLPDPWEPVKEEEMEP